MGLFIYTLRSVSGAIVTPPLVFLLILLIIVLHSKNKKVVTMQKIILGGSVNSSIELTLSQLVLGIIGGIIGSIILTSLGVVFSENSGISYLFVISILLMLIRPRLICFSYSGAILGGLVIIIKLINIFIPNSLGVLDLNIFYLAILIGVFHVIEGILVIIDGDRGAVPVFTNRNNKILGGYALKRYWALPIAIIIAMNANNSMLSYMTDSISNPDWWPLIKLPYGLALIAGSIISIVPFYMVLGYSSITFTKSKREKAVSSGVHILVYGILLIISAQIARFGIIGEIFIVIFMPVTHELMLKLQVNSEKNKMPKFVSDEEGLMVLEISADSKMREFGIGIESKVLSVNGKSINSEAEVYGILKENLYNAVLKVKNSHGMVKDIQFRHNKNTRLGILLVPRNVSEEDIVAVDGEDFKSVLNSLKGSEKNVDYKIKKENDMEHNKDIKNKDNKM
ncbi:hypothetical protein [Clostridium beijerinckii]|uniref:hypothetical protein n=1 Tax=Clostridium beijerinckii TaxID=1520 RepID=UPI00047B690A|nr:hypothetical protein [Clostridium beijerinckii]